jgi:alkylation response protein AidB-like acyl-CoA dehydrogenase
MQGWVEAEVLRLLQARASAARAAGGGGPEGSLGKLAVSRVWRQIAQFLPDLVGAPGMLIDSYGTAGGPSAERRTMLDGGAYAAQHFFLGSPSISIAGGTDDIQRNIIGERVLGLPREPSVDKGVPWNQTLRS